jgi:hypothetical protein
MPYQDQDTILDNKLLFELATSFFICGVIEGGDIQFDMVSEQFKNKYPDVFKDLSRGTQ